MNECGDTTTVDAAASATSADSEESMFRFTAAQVAERFVEVFGLPSKRRKESLLECLDVNVIEVVAVGNEEVLAEGKEELELHCTSVPIWKAEAVKRLYVEGNKPADPTYCVDFYLKGQAPGWGLEGLASEAAERSDIWVLYVVQDNKVKRVYVGDDTQRLGRKPGVSEEDIFGTDVFMKVLDIAIRPGGITGTDISKHYHDYTKIEVWG